MTLDDRIFLLQHTTELPNTIKQRLVEADVAYLQDREAEATRIVEEIETWCENNGVNIINPFGYLAA